MSEQIPSPGIDIFNEVNAPANDWAAEMRPRRKVIGGLAVLLAITAWVANGFAVGLALDPNDRLSTSFVIVSICASALAFGGGLFAFLTRRGRFLGVLGAVLGVVANPFVLIALLEFFARFASN